MKPDLLLIQSHGEVVHLLLIMHLGWKFGTAIDFHWMLNSLSGQKFNSFQAGRAVCWGELQHSRAKKETMTVMNLTHRTLLYYIYHLGFVLCSIRFRHKQAVFGPWTQPAPLFRCRKTPLGAEALEPLFLQFLFPAEKNGRKKNPES